jgi:prepilin-type N-terminal cleavage/methylation domain-containing protein
MGGTAKKEARKTPPMRISTATTSNSGFSLIEILVVIGLMALITGIFVPSFTGVFRESGEAFIRQTALMMGQARDRALLTDKLIRLRIDLDKQVMALDEAPSEYLVPKLPDGALSEREKEEQAKKEAATFRPVSELMKEPRKMPEGIRIIQVKSPRYKKPVTEGVALVYFFNNGNTDGATIYLETAEKTHQAITIHPITGVSKLEARGPEGSP